MNTCKNCGKEINNQNKYCSLKCRNIFVNKHIRDYNKNGNAISKKAKQIYYKNPKLCKLCGKIISYEKKENVFCSKDCRINSLIIWNEKQRGIKKHFKESALINIINANYKRFHNNPCEKPTFCKECGIELSFQKRKHVFCCIDCKKIYDKKNMSKYQIYYKECQFNFNLSDYPNEFDFDLINKFGWYKAKNHGNNINGISRDHMVSIKFGYENNISPEIIHHPANCQLMVHNDNIGKHTKCSIALNDLLNRINDWNLKYKLS